MRRVYILVVPQVEILDLAGPLQVLHEANGLGANYRITLCGPSRETDTAQPLTLAGLQPLPDVTADDLVLVPGIRLDALDDVGPDVQAWLRDAHGRNAHICSICSAAFILGRIGLLDGRQCTTHWKHLQMLARQFPRAKVVGGRLFVQDGRVTTSAGIASGIDLTLSLIEAHHGPSMAAAVAREMVIYLRRDGYHTQDSIYLDYRAHLHPGVHEVQDILQRGPQRKHRLVDLARQVAMSERNLTRVFRQSTGISIGEYIARLRLELARTLMSDPSLSLDAVATRCGFETARQLRRLWKKYVGTLAWRRARPREE